MTLVGSEFPKIYFRGRKPALILWALLPGMESPAYHADEILIKL
jgi:hypothetical protein